MTAPFVLLGRVVTMDDAFTVHDPGAVYVAGDRIVAAGPEAGPVPSGFAGAPRVRTRGTIYPGLIELHNHLSYNALPLWPAPQRYDNRGQWQGIEAYRRGVSGPMKVLGLTEGLPESVVRYVECKCLVAGVTTSQGIALYSNAGIQRYYVGNVRNVESTRDEALHDVLTKIPDIEARDAEAWLVRLRKAYRMLLHLAEGIGPTARRHFEALHLADDTWALAPSLVGIHATGLTAADYAVLATHGVGIVWSPLSNLMLYGATTDVAAAKAAGVRVSLGSDWSPSGSRNLLAELKVARVVSRLSDPPIFSDREVLALATSEPAKMLGWQDQLGSVVSGRLADLVVIAGTALDPYEQILGADERSVALVVVDGVPRFGWPSLIRRLCPGDPVEALRIARRERVLHLVEETADPIVGAIDLATAERRLKAGLGDLPRLAKQLEQPSPEASLARLSDARPQWFLQLDHDEPAGVATRPHLPDEDGRPTGEVDLDMALASIPLSQLLVAMDLDPLTVAGDAGYAERIASQPNLPPAVAAALRDAFG